VSGGAPARRASARVLAAAAALVIALGPAGCGRGESSGTSPTPPALEPLTVQAFPAFVDSFNRAADRTRVLVLLSPT